MPFSRNQPPRFFIVLACCIVFCLCNSQTFAQDDDVSISRIPSTAGAPFQSVYDITQDTEGFLWAGTNNGAYRFDGFTFTNADQFGESPRLTGTAVRQVIEDNTGTLWFASQDVVSMNSRTSKTFHYPLHDARLFMDSNGSIWAANDSLFRFDQTQHQFISYPLRLEGELPRFWAVSSSVDHNVLWVISIRSKGIFRITISSAVVEFFPLPGSFKTDRERQVTMLSQDRSGMLWLGIEESLFRFNPRTGTYVQKMPIGGTRSMAMDMNGRVILGSTMAPNALIIDSTQQDDPEPLSVASWPRQILCDRHGDLWFASRGLFRYTTNGFLRAYHYEPSDPHTISTNALTCLFEDRSGVKWIGTEGGGICKVERTAKNFLTYSSAGDSTTENFNVRALKEDNAGNLWIGSFEGLHVLRKGSGLQQFRIHGFRKQDTNGQPMIGALMPESNGLLWFGNWGTGPACVLDTRSGRAYPLTIPGIEMDQVRSIRAIVKDPDGSAWIGSTGSGLIHVAKGAAAMLASGSGNPAVTVFHHDPANDRSLVSDMIYSMHCSVKGNLWIGTVAGLCRYDRATGSFTRYVHDRANPHSLSMNEVRAVHEDADGIVWAGTNGGGLNRLDPATGTIRTFTTADGLPHSMIYGILEDDHQNLWLTTQNGLCRFNTKTFSARNYMEEDGLQNNEFNTGAYDRGRSGLMYIGGIEGFDIFHPDSIYDNPFVPPVYITGGKVFDQPFELVAGLQFAHDRNFLSFGFVGLNYLRQDQNRYAFILKGFEKDRHTVSQGRSADYFGLGPGTYTFLVKAANNDGVWNEQPASFTFTILPPWWETWWFRALALISFLSIGPAIYVRRVNVLKREKLVQEEFSRHLIDNVEAERKRIAGEIHDSLGQNLLVVKNMLETTAVSIEGQNGSKNGVQKTLADALDVIGQTVQEARSMSYNLHPLMLEELGLTRALHLLLRKSSESFKFELSNEIDNIDGLFSPEGELHLFRIVQECINNIVKHSGAEKVEVVSRCEGGELVLTIRDNGRGFDPQKQEQQEIAKGFGRKNMRERARMLGAVVSVESSPGFGATVTIRTPIPTPAKA